MVCNMQEEDKHGRQDAKEGLLWQVRCKREASISRIEAGDARYKRGANIIE